MGRRKGVETMRAKELSRVLRSTRSIHSLELWPEATIRLHLLFIQHFYCVKYIANYSVSISSVQFSHSVMSDSLRPHESQHARPPCPSPTPGVHSDSLPSSQWCHPAISSSVIPFSSCPQSLPESESFPMSQLRIPVIKWKRNDRLLLYCNSCWKNRPI